MTIETRPPAAKTLADVVASGYLHGYVPGPPPEAPPEAIAIDQGVCRDAACEHCGTRGLRYLPYHRRGSYVAFMICPACFLCVEF